MVGSRSGYRTRAVGAGEARAAMTERARRVGGADLARGTETEHRDVAHVLVENAASGRVVCCYRMTGQSDGAEVRRSFAVRFCDPEGLARFEAPLLEIGRFCVEAGPRDPDVRRVAWCALLDHLDRPGLEILFGGSGIAGARWEPFLDVFAALLATHPEPGARETGAGRAAARRIRRSAAQADVGAALRRMPGVRTWFAAGGEGAEDAGCGGRRTRERADIGV